LGAPPPRLRVARGEDADALAVIYAPIVRDTAISFELAPPDADEMRRRTTATLATHPWLVAEDADGVAGYAYASAHRVRGAYRFSLDVSVYTAERARRRGIGAALYTALLGIASAQGFHRAYAGITLPNPASAALHERLGFAFLGAYREVGFKLGVWHDVGWWERPFPSEPGTPREPHAFAAWRESAQGRRRLEALGVAA
jgi:phosphinothricin acetyltransferase